MEDVAGSLPPARWIVASLAAYIVLGLLLRTVVLNWVVGPLWLFLTLYVAPTALRATWRGADR